MSPPQPDSDRAVEPDQQSRSTPGLDRDLLIALLLSQRNRDSGRSWIWIAIIWALIWALWPADLHIKWPAMFG
jgi:hypothetical protein